MSDDPGDVLDLTIIGGGPTGLYGAFYAGLRSMRTRIVDSLEQLGGQLSALYPEKFIYDVGGYPAVLARTLAAELVKQALQYHPELVLGEQAQALRRAPDGTLDVQTDRGVYRSRTVLIAAGGGSFVPKRLPDPQIARYEDRGLSYFVSDPQQFRRQRVLVIGGGDTAVDWALALSRLAADVTLIHRRDIFRAHEDSLRKLAESRVNVRTFCELTAIRGESAVEAAVLRDTRTREEFTLPADAILVNIGFSSTLGPIQRWGLVLDAAGIVVNQQMETNIPGVFAAGDIASYPGKLRLIATGFGEAAIAVNHARVRVDPASRVYPGHSTDLVPRLRRAAGQTPPQP